MEACMLHIGYHKVPSRKMVWEMTGDCRDKFMADAIRRDTLETLMLYFAENAMADQDKFFKVT